MNWIVLLKELAAAAGDLRPSLEEGNEEGEPWCQVNFLTESRVGQITVWSRPHVGGLADVEVINEDGSTVLYKHYEGLNRETLELAWKLLVSRVSSADQS